MILESLRSLDVRTAALVLLLVLPYETVSQNASNATNATTSVQIQTTTPRPSLPVSLATPYDQCYILNKASGLSISVNAANSLAENEYGSGTIDEAALRTPECKTSYVNMRCIINGKPKDAEGSVLKPCFSMCVAWRRACVVEDEKQSYAQCKEIADRSTDRWTSASTNRGCFGSNGAGGMLGDHALLVNVKVSGFVTKTAFLNNLDLLLGVVAEQCQNGVQAEGVKLVEYCTAGSCSLFLPKDVRRQVLQDNDVSLVLRVTLPDSTEVGKAISRLKSTEFGTEATAAATRVIGISVSLSVLGDPTQINVSGSPSRYSSDCGFLSLLVAAAVLLAHVIL